MLNEITQAGKGNKKVFKSIFKIDFREGRRETEKERERGRFVIPLIYTYIS